MSFVPASEGTRVELRRGESMIWKAPGPLTNGAYDLVDMNIAPQIRSTQHRHMANDEAFYILDGLFRLKFGEDVVEASAGSFLFVPRGTTHAWINVGEREGRMLLIFTPGGIGGFFTEMQKIVPAIVAAAGDRSKLDEAIRRKELELAREYQYEIVGPPWSGD